MAAGLRRLREEHGGPSQEPRVYCSRIAGRLRLSRTCAFVNTDLLTSQRISETKDRPHSSMRKCWLADSSRLKEHAGFSTGLPKTCPQAGVLF